MVQSFFQAMLEGLVLGLTLAILTGPGFFALLQTSIRNGYKFGIAFAIGVLLSDSTVIILSYLGALKLFNDPKNSFVMGIVGGTILMMFGLFNIFQKSPLELNGKNNRVEKFIVQTSTLPMTLLKGFAINTINPFVIIFWLGVVNVETTRYTFSDLDIITLFVSTLLTVFSTDVLKSMAAQRITSFLNPRILLWVNRVAGIILIASGIIMIWKVVHTFF